MLNIFNFLQEKLNNIMNELFLIIPQMSVCFSLYLQKGRADLQLLSNIPQQIPLSVQISSSYHFWNSQL